MKNNDVDDDNKKKIYICESLCYRTRRESASNDLIPKDIWYEKGVGYRSNDNVSRS